MYASRVFVRSVVVVCLSTWGVSVALAQSGIAQPTPHQHQTSPAPKPEGAQPPVSPPPQDHAHHDATPASPFAAREASGTAWLPEVSPMYGIHQDAGTWQLMWHGAAFAQYLRDGGERGQEQAGSINWAMGMARRELRGGRFGVRGMVSLEPLTIRECGYPDLLATGETCDGEAIHDRQHPHDLIMEAAIEYERPFAGTRRWHLYGGLAGEPALGPAAYPHRPSAMPNPLAPISHHWFDATHITFGVVTAGVSDRRWKAEASIFNGREPDEERWNLDLAPFDSVSARLWFAPSPSLVMQVSAGRLEEAEPGHDEGRVDVTRVTASATYHRAVRAGSLLAATAAWGRNAEAGEASQAFLVEGSLTLDERHTWFARVEAAGKPAHDLDVHDSDETFTVAKFQGGYTRYFRSWRGLAPGVGGSVSAGLVPRSLIPTYGGRATVGFGLFLTLRPSSHGM